MKKYLFSICLILCIMLCGCSIIPKLVNSGDQNKTESQEGNESNGLIKSFMESSSSAQLSSDTVTDTEEKKTQNTNRETLFNEDDYWNNCENWEQVHFDSNMKEKVVQAVIDSEDIWREKIGDEYAYFYFADLNFDGIPELLLKNDIYEGFEFMENAFYFDNGRFVKTKCKDMVNDVEAFSNPLLYYDSSNKKYMWFGFLEKTYEDNGVGYRKRIDYQLFFNNGEVEIKPFEGSLEEISVLGEYTETEYYKYDENGRETTVSETEYRYSYDVRDGMISLFHSTTDSPVSDYDYAAASAQEKRELLEALYDECSYDKLD